MDNDQRSFPLIIPLPCVDIVEINDFKNAVIGRNLEFCIIVEIRLLKGPKWMLHAVRFCMCVACYISNVEQLKILDLLKVKLCFQRMFKF